MIFGDFEKIIKWTKTFFQIMPARPSQPGCQRIDISSTLKKNFRFLTFIHLSLVSVSIVFLNF